MSNQKQHRNVGLSIIEMLLQTTGDQNKEKLIRIHPSHHTINKDLLMPDINKSLKIKQNSIIV
jgi:hypothetical protein